MVFNLSAAGELAAVIGVAGSTIGGIGAYIISVEKRLNGKAALKATLQEIQADQKTQGQHIQDIAIVVARVDTFVGTLPCVIAKSRP